MPFVAGQVPIATAVAHSQNAKLGDCATTYAAQASCPRDCVFFDGGGCYAETGQVGKFVTSPLNEAAAEARASGLDVAIAEAAAIDQLRPDGRPLRLHTVGDCATDESARVVSAAAERYMERGGGPVWTYTHAWRVVARESWGAVSVLASCETADDVDQARERGYAPSVVVEEHPGRRRYLQARITAEGLEEIDVLPCPAQTGSAVCSNCRLCMDDQALLARGYAIGFELHGLPVAVRQARAALRRPDDPARRVPSEQRIRDIRDRYLADGAEPSVLQVAAEIPDLSETSIYEWLRYLRGEIVHPSQRRQRARDLQRAVA